LYHTRVIAKQKGFAPQMITTQSIGLMQQYPEIAILLYWLIAGLLGFIFLRDWLIQWHVRATLSHRWLVVFLVATWLVGQTIYL
jgi:hypothetical protein